MNQQLVFKLSKIPHKPGVYLWKDKYRKVIYVGKANDLFNRVHQYLLPANNSRTSILMQHVVDIDVIVVANENAALLLENNLIKKYQPTYNVLLKSGSGYPYIVVTSEPHPRLIYTRDLKKIKGKYYGPFAMVKPNRYDIYDFLYKLFPLRKCNVLPKQKCMFYDIGQCLGPCINKVGAQTYMNIKNQINNFFTGDINAIEKILMAKEVQAADQQNFEEAEKQKQLIMGLRKINNHQNIELANIDNVDVIGYYSHNNCLSIEIFSYLKGKLLAKNQQISEYYTKLDDELISYLIQYYRDSKNNPSSCVINLNSKDLSHLSQILGIDFINSKAGKYKSILQTAAFNAKAYLDSNYLVYKHHQKLSVDAMEDLKNVLNIDNLALIHVFDMSNLFGDTNVGGMIALENGQYNKNLYRKFIIKDLDAKGDAQYMNEVICRKYRGAIQNHETLPNLIIVDGGIIQVRAAIKALSTLNLQQIIPVIGLVKDQHHKTHAIVLSNGRRIALEKNTSLYLYLSNIQEEVHRFTINLFRSKDSKSKIRSVLHEIPGLGTKGIEKLLSQYDNIDNIRRAPLEELSQYVSTKVANEIKRRFKKYV